MTEVVRRCTGADLPRLMELFRTVYRYNPRMQERDYLQWQFQAGSAGHKADYNIWLVAGEDGIHSFLGFVPAEMYYQGRILPCCWPQNWACLSGDYAGLTVLSRLMEDYDSLLYAGLAPDTVAIFNRMQIPVLLEMPRWIGILQAEQAARIFSVESAEDRRRLFESQAHLRSLPAGAEIQRVSRFDPEEDFTFARWPEIIGYSRRTGRYLNWRYFDIPRHSYQTLRNDAGQFAVYRIEKIKNQEEAVVRILEWSFFGVAAASALQTMVADGLQHNAILLDFFCTAEGVGGELEKLGFLRENHLQSPIPYLFRPIKQNAPGLAAAIDLPPHRTRRDLDFRQWYITKGDSDIDRIKL